MHPSRYRSPPRRAHLRLRAQVLQFFSYRVCRSQRDMGCGASNNAAGSVEEGTQQEKEDKRGTTQSVREAAHAADIRPTALDPGLKDNLTRSRLLWARDTNEVDVNEVDDS